MRLTFPHRPGGGGPGSFQSRFQAALARRGWSINFAVDGDPALTDLVMVVGGTRRIAWLHRMRQKGVPIIYRLDGLLWLHRVGGFRAAPSRWLGSELRNAMEQWIHGRLADCVVYQSDFVRDWWGRKGWWQPSDAVVIRNGLDLQEFQPVGAGAGVGNANPDVVCVEGHVDYSPYAIDLLNAMVGELAERDAKLIVYGGFADPSGRERLDGRIDYRGSIPREAVSEVYRDRLYLSLDVNPACPNAVVEALASGAPVIGFDTGSVSELVGDAAGRIVPFGADPWKGDAPKIQPLIEAYQEVAGRFEAYSAAARLRAERCFDLGKMVDAYVEVVERTIDRCVR